MAPDCKPFKRTDDILRDKRNRGTISEYCGNKHLLRLEDKLLMMIITKKKTDKLIAS